MKTGLSTHAPIEQREMSNHAVRAHVYLHSRWSYFRHLNKFNGLLEFHFQLNLVGKGKIEENIQLKSKYDISATQHDPTMGNE